MCFDTFADWLKSAWSQIHYLIETISNWLVDCVFQVQNATFTAFVTLEIIVGACLFGVFLFCLWILAKILRFILYCTGSMCVAHSVPVPMPLIGSPPQPPVHAHPPNPQPVAHQPHLQPAAPIPIPNALIGNIFYQMPPPPRPINPDIPYRHNDRDVLANDHPSGANRNPGPPSDPANRPILVPGPRTPSPGWNNENDPENHSLNQTHDSN